MEKNLIIDIKKIIQKFMYRNKCKSFIILNNKKEILKYNSSHNHPEKEYDVSLSIMKHKVKDTIEKSSIPYGIKIKPLYNKIFKEMRFISNKISVLIERYKNIENKIIDTKCDRNNTINLWFDCLTNLNNII
ncbi:hypothetical protein H8356DRAFT_1276251 [Neocallimastix lanati (nom. inval.)]|nr:hypothetical protein H8356DRAFT_1276251 [Neocallimastix sp. JGI-2020a]